MIEYREVMGETAHSSPTVVGECLGCRGVINEDHQTRFVSGIEALQAMPSRGI
jgi:hypothetical protein